MKVRAVVMALSGDIEWYCSQLNFPYAMSNSPCPYCKSDNLKEHSRVPFTDLSANAAWKATLLSAGELRGKFGSHPSMQVHGINVFTIKLDTLHVVDLGVACHAFGNLLWEIVEDHLVGNRITSMQELYELITNCYDGLGVPAKHRIGKLKQTNLCGGGQHIL